MSPSSGPLVSAVEIENLYGKKSISLNLARGDETQDQRLSLLYGNNGSGKTTVLRLLWNALSPSMTEGHRTRISRTPFKRFTIYLHSGDVITFTKAEDLVGDFTVSVMNGQNRIVEQSYHETPRGLIHLNRDDDSQQIELLLEDDFSKEERIRFEFEREVTAYRRHSRRKESDQFSQYLGRISAGPYMLADDRRIYGDDIETKRRSQTVRSDEAELRPTTHGVSAELTTAMRRVNDLLQKMVINGNVSGSLGSNNVYLGILEKVSQTNLSKVDSTTRINLIGRLNQIAGKTKEYSAYGLVPRIDQAAFLNLLERTPDDKIGVAEDVMQPFLEAQQARLDGLSSVAYLLETLTTAVNQFLMGGDKKIRYNLQRGLRVYSEDGTVLPPEALSSGERQILLLLLNTVLARDNTRLFLIDEPELSLNVKWQRQLMRALLALTEGSSVQFIVATHSIEIITGHRDSVAKVTSIL